MTIVDDAYEALDDTFRTTAEIAERMGVSRCNAYNKLCKLELLRMAEKKNHNIQNLCYWRRNRVCDDLARSIFTEP